MRDAIFILHIAFVDGFGVNSQENDSFVWIHGVGALCVCVILYAGGCIICVCATD